jgi:hypothetical protein
LVAGYAAVYAYDTLRNGIASRCTPGDAFAVGRASHPDPRSYGLQPAVSFSLTVGTTTILLPYAGGGAMSFGCGRSVLGRWVDASVGSGGFVRGAVM